MNVPVVRRILSAAAAAALGLSLTACSALSSDSSGSKASGGAEGAHFRALWILRINAAARLEGFSYSKLMGCLHKAGIEINRKVLADLAVNHPEAFKAIVEKAKTA